MSKWQWIIEVTTGGKLEMCALPRRIASEDSVVLDLTVGRGASFAERRVGWRKFKLDLEIEEKG
jgi:hypothetical protein